MKRLLLTLAAALCACSEPKAGLPVEGASLIESLSIAEADSGASRWRLKARSARMEEKKGVIFFTSPAVKFYDGEKITSEITSMKGEMLMREKEAELNGAVKINAVKDGMRLATERLFYSSARNKIWTQEKITINKGNTVITGRGFTANPDLSEIEIKHQETRMAGK
ncbi:MAG: LPS export ABC transporter periplasmic protein LptC [Elusimicrobia bacterium]|nr:LPS export ABC transporter periplasmic protein LptC [Elusimicrobiota bacterium]